MPRQLSTVDLEALITKLASRLPRLRAVALFGSRRFRTGSPRSDLDLLLYFDEAPATTDLAEHARAVSVYIDPFLVQPGDHAESAINGSRIRLDPGKGLEESVDAVEVWTRSQGFVGRDYRTHRILRDFTPWYTLAEIQGNRSGRREPVDYLVVTALDEEYEAVRDALKPYEEDIDPRFGMIGHQFVATIPHARAEEDETLILCQSDRMGNIASALTTAEALTRWAPRLAILVGITGGLRGRTKLGDVVVADRILDYESSKVTRFKTAWHGLKLVPSPGVRHRVMTWEGLAAAVAAVDQDGSPPGPRRVISGGYASGEKVVARRRLARRVAKHDRKLAAVEMESLGVADACRREGVEHLVLKAVTDMADSRKSDDYHEYCCRLTSSLLVAFLKNRVLLGDPS